MDEFDQNDEQFTLTGNERLRQILGRVPDNLFFWANTIVALVVVGLVSLLFILKYPRIVNAEITVTGKVPPMELVAKKNGHIEQIFFENDEPVKRGDILAIIESAAQYDDMLYLAELFNHFSTIDEYYFIVDTLRKNLQLGNCQQAYADFIREQHNYKNLIGVGYYPARLDALGKEYAYYTTLIGQLVKNEHTLLSDYQLSQIQFKRDSILERKGVISASVFEASESLMLKKLKDYQSKLEERISIEMKRSSVHQQILQIQLQMKLDYAQAYNLLEQKFDVLKSQVENWKNDYVLEAPIDGQVAYFQVWSAHQNVVEGDVVMSVVPLEKNDTLTGRLRIASFGAGRIKEGNKVLIKFDDYPYLEFGMVIGRLTKVSRVPVMNSYYGEVCIDRLVTTRSVELPFRNKMTGTAEIVAEQQRLIEYLFEPISSALRVQHELKD